MEDENSRDPEGCEESSEKGDAASDSEVCEEGDTAVDDSSRNLCR